MGFCACVAVGFWGFKIGSFMGELARLNVTRFSKSGRESTRAIISCLNARLLDLGSEYRRAFTTATVVWDEDAVLVACRTRAAMSMPACYIHRIGFGFPATRTFRSPAHCRKGYHDPECDNVSSNWRSSLGMYANRRAWTAAVLGVLPQASAHVVGGVGIPVKRQVARGPQRLACRA